MNRSPLVRFSPSFLPRAIATAVLLCGLLPAIIYAQSSTSNVNVTVKDETGGLIPGAALTLTDNATQTSKTGVTNDEGFHTFNEVQAGTYTLIVERQGFKRTEVQEVTVNVGIPAAINVSLSAGGVSETVTVSSSDAQAVINTENAQLSTTVQLRQVQDLPLNGRNPIGLAGLQAGVGGVGDNVRTASINGMRGTYSNITWNGINVNDNFVRTDSLFASAAPTVSGVAEFTITTQNGGAEDGLGVGQVKFISPRGTTDFHGQLFEFHRNHKFDANTFFNNSTINPLTGAGVTKPKLIRNEFGGNVGGPFRVPRFGEGGPMWYGENKLFFYGYYEGNRTRSDASRNRTVLRDAARSGVFTYLRADNGQTQTLNLLQLTGRAVDPKIISLIDLQPGFNNSDVGDSRNTGGFRFNSPSGSNSDTIGLRIDFELSDRHKFEISYNRFKFQNPNDTFNDIGEVFPGLLGGGQASTRKLYALAWSWVPTQNMTNEVRFGSYSTNPVFFNNEKFAEGYRLSFPLSTNPVQTFLPQGRVPTNYDFMDNASWTKDEHVIRFGGLYRVVHVAPYNDAGTIPLYTLGFNTVLNRSPLSTSQFPGGIASNDFTTAGNLLALLTGAVTSATQTFQIKDRDSGFVPGLGSRRNIDYKTLSFYGQDTWRLRSNLTLNLGLRWEYVSPPTERNGLALLPREMSLDALSDPNVVLDFAGKGTGRPFHNSDWNNFAPNVSFAWDPFGSGKTSVRGGYAISYVIDNNVTTVQNAAIASNAGLSSAVTLTGLGGTISGSGIIPIPAPAFRVPRTIADNLSISQTPTLYTIDPDLKTPYIQQWNIGIEREILRDTVFEIRYVGNRGVKLTRGVDINQTRIFGNGFFEDFLRAQGNLAAVRAERTRITNDASLTAAQRTALLNARPVSGAFNTLVPGSIQLQVFPRLGNGGALNDSTFVTLIDQNQVGELASRYVQNRNTYLTIGANGSQLGPGFFLPANPSAFVVDYIGNGSWSTYHGLQTEVRRRLSNGVLLQANYTWSKAFSDFEGSQANFQGLLDLDRGDVVEKRRIGQDVTHNFKANAIFELPFGRGRRFFDRNGWADKLIGGFQLSGIFQARSGRPINIVSQRGTLNRTDRSGVNTVNTTLTIPEIQEITGLFFHPTTGRPLLFDPSIIDANGRASTEFFQNPGPGQVGQLQQTPVSGPGYWTLDTALIKRVRFSENTNIELRLDAFNVLNHTNFNVGETQDINSTSFGRISSTYEPRILQFAFKFNF